MQCILTIPPENIKKRSTCLKHAQIKGVIFYVLYKYNNMYSTCVCMYVYVCY
jgi:hypothetical protein